MGRINLGAGSPGPRCSVFSWLWAPDVGLSWGRDAAPDGGSRAGSGALGTGTRGLHVRPLRQLPPPPQGQGGFRIHKRKFRLRSHRAQRHMPHGVNGDRSQRPAMGPTSQGGQDPGWSRGSDVRPVPGSVGGGRFLDGCLPLATHRDELRPTRLGDRDILVPASREGSVLTFEAGSGGGGHSPAPGDPLRSQPCPGAGCP